MTTSCAAATPPNAVVSPSDWNALLAPYRKPILWRSLFQLANTGVLFGSVWFLMLWSLEFGYWITLLLAVPAALLLVRMFILQHDCGHGSFFKSRAANDVVGFIIGVFTLVPYNYWRKTHAIHHATSGDLERRTFGDIDTLTVREYLSLSKRKRLMYRIYRHPFVMLFVGPTYQFIIKHRLPVDTPRSWKREWASVHWTNAAIALVVVVMWLTVGLERLLLVQLPITLIAGSIGVFLFYVQHQYEDTYWRYHEAWNYYDAGLRGSSLYVLPPVLQWFTANIGLHHIHHLCSRIPNYRLPECLNDNPEFHNVTKLTLVESIRTLWLSLWDDTNHRLIGFRELRFARPPTAESVPASRPAALPKAWR